MAAPSLEPLAAELAPQGVQFLFIYVREAHPAENYPHHISFEQKIAHARAVRDTFNVRRPILVDDLTGTAHALYGRLPNMLYIVSGGNVFFKANWTDAPSVRLAIEYLLKVTEQRRTGERLAPFYVEMQGFRQHDRPKFAAGLQRAGPAAVEQFARLMERMRAAGRPPAG